MTTGSAGCDGNDPEREPTFEEIDATARGLFEAERPMDFWACVDEGVRNYYRQETLLRNIADPSATKLQSNDRDSG